MTYRLIAHKIHKVQHSTKAEIYFRKSLIPSSAEAESFVEELRGAIKRHSPQGAKFLQPAGEQAPIQSRIVRYISAASDDEFLSLSMDASRKLRAEMESEPLTSGGYLVFAEYEYGRETYLLIVLLSTKARARFDTEMNLLEVDTLDVDHVRHAARFRYLGVASNDQGAVQFVARSSDGIFFRKFIDCDPISDTAAQANLLKTFLNKWSDQESHNDEQRDEVLRQTYGYWKICKESGTNMTLAGLANRLYPDTPQRLLNFLSKEDTGLDGEFSPPSGGSMRQFQKFSFSGKGLKLEFDRRSWGGKIAIKNATVTIRNVPPELIKQLEGES